MRKVKQIETIKGVDHEGRYVVTVRIFTDPINPSDIQELSQEEFDALVGYQGSFDCEIDNEYRREDRG